MAYINVVETLLPEYSYPAEDCVKYYQNWVKDQDDRYKRKAELIFKNTMISHRHSILDIDTVFRKRSFEESNDVFREKSEELCTKLFLQTVEKAGLKPTDIDVLITTSCTGYMIPAVNFFIAKHTGMRRDVRHIPITEIGCAAGVAGLIFADDYIKAYPDKKVVVLSHEFPSNTIQLEDFSFENLIGSVIFADGLGCAIVSNEPTGYKYIDNELYHLYERTDLLGYNITNTGLKMNLSKTIPQVIQDNFNDIIKNIFERNKLSISDIGKFLFHPGGVKILDKIEAIIQSLGKNVDESRKIMASFGNISSSTIFFILQEAIKNPVADEKIFLASFGPGFSTYQLLLEG